MPIYTRTGDEGDTGLFGNRRVAKDHPRLRAYGTVDELNAFVGLLRSEGLPRDLDERCDRIQCMLFEIGADLATEGGRASVGLLGSAIPQAEGWIDEADGQLPPLRSFILPGGHRESALLHVLRTVARRAERLVWALDAGEGVPPEIGRYLNRLSDLFFVWARLRNQQNAVPDTPWSRARSDAD